MGYEIAINKAWDEIKEKASKFHYVRFLNDKYEIDCSNKNIISVSCNTPAKDYYKLLILHYIAREYRVSEVKDGKWISFKELEGGEAYFSAFKKRAIDPILRKYGNSPSSIFERCNSFNAEKINAGTAAISISAFPKIKVTIILWGRDDEFTADCNMLFNPEIKDILPTEDIAVLGGITASLL